jgi:hypothetical protein
MTLQAPLKTGIPTGSGINRRYFTFLARWQKIAFLFF